MLIHDVLQVTQALQVQVRHIDLNLSSNFTTFIHFALNFKNARAGDIFSNLIHPVSS